MEGCFCSCTEDDERGAPLDPSKWPAVSFVSPFYMELECRGEFFFVHKSALCRSSKLRRLVNVSADNGNPTDVMTIGGFTSRTLMQMLQFMYMDDYDEYPEIEHGRTGPIKVSRPSGEIPWEVCYGCVYQNLEVSEIAQAYNIGALHQLALKKFHRDIPVLLQSEAEEKGLSPYSDDEIKKLAEECIARWRHARPNQGTPLEVAAYTETSKN